MARQAGEYRFIGTLDDLCFYKMNGLYYVRTKSSLTGKRFWREKAFEGSRRSASRFGEGNRLASSVYSLVSEEKRTNRLFPFLRAKAIDLLKEQRSSEEVVQLLLDCLVDFGFIIIEPNEKTAIDGGVRNEKRRNGYGRMDVGSNGSCKDSHKSDGSFAIRFSIGFNSS